VHVNDNQQIQEISSEEGKEERYMHLLPTFLICLKIFRNLFIMGRREYVFKKKAKENRKKNTIT